MSVYKQNIIAHYAETDLVKRILKTIEEASERIKHHSDTARFDEFHVRGREATRELALLAKLKPGMSVLDIGSGIGGPARTIAAEFGCKVTGIDIVDEYCKAASFLSKHLKLNNLVDFKCGNILETSFTESSFDAAVSFHTTMNIENKELLFSKISKILKPGGKLAIYEICAGQVSKPHFPLPWASDPSINFLDSQDELLKILEASGFKKTHWKDLTQTSIDFLFAKVAPKNSNHSKQPSLWGLDILMGENAVEKTNNLLKNLEEKRLTIIQGVFQIAFDLL